MSYLGDFAEDATVYCWWSSNTSAGASVTRATNGTVSVYKIDNTTQSVAGVTDNEDFDSLTGVHLVEVDTSADVFYAVGNDYAIVLSASTIDGQTVNTVLGQFSIENRFVEVDAVKISGDSAAADKLELMVENALGADNKMLISTDAQDRSATLDVNTKTITADALDAAAVKADAVTKIQAGLALTGNDGDTLETLSDQIDAFATIGSVPSLED